MNSKLLLILFFCFSTYGLFSQNTKCLIETTLGNITIELYDEQAPITVKNFLRYVKDGKYERSNFHRVCTAENEATRDVKIEVIQGGLFLNYDKYDPIVLETTDKTGILHKHGVLSMARAEPNSATSSFFICINDQPSLDYGGARNPDGQGFAAFGKVIDGMDLVLRIQGLPNTEQTLNEPVVIENIKKL